MNDYILYASFCSLPFQHNGFIHYFNKYILSSCYVPSSGWSPGKPSRFTASKNLLGDRNSKQISIWWQERKSQCGEGKGVFLYISWSGKASPKRLEARPSVKSERCGHLSEGLWAKRAAGEDPEAGAAELVMLLDNKGLGAWAAGGEHPEKGTRPHVEAQSAKLV